MVKLKLWACQQLLKRYIHSEKVAISTEVLIDALAVVYSQDTQWFQKKAARIILDYQFGKNEVDEMIQEYAVITDRNDSLVRNWRKLVLERDSMCVNCGEHENLHAHHISHWCDDPVNRINVDNGITLCATCHSFEHPEISGLILSQKGGAK